LSQRNTYPPGVPCWVETSQPDPEAAAAFYGALMGWEIDAGIARLGGRRVAGIGQAPPGSPTAFWSMFVRVESLAATVAVIAEEGGSVLVGPTAQGVAVVADRTGVPFGLSDRHGVEVVDEPGTWAMSALHTPDVEAAEAFYALFGWEAERVPGTPLVRFRRPGYEPVVAVMTPTEDGVPPHWAVNFRVEDVDAVAVRALDLGGALLMPPTDAPGFRNAVIADPQGGVIAVSALVA
jgi:predicted enzyme related to lactoylglutathione lyase